VQDTTSWDTPGFITKGALAADSFKRIQHDGYPGRNSATAIVGSLPAFSNRWNTNGPNIFALFYHLGTFCLRVWLVLDPIITTAPDGFLIIFFCPMQDQGIKACYFLNTDKKAFFADIILFFPPCQFPFFSCFGIRSIIIPL
jgi:hypothetical protein